MYSWRGTGLDAIFWKFEDWQIIDMGSSCRSFETYLRQIFEVVFSVHNDSC